MIYPEQGWIRTWGETIYPCTKNILAHVPINMLCPNTPLFMIVKNSKALIS